MTELIETLERGQMRPVPDFRVGDRVRVHFQVVEGTRRRTQVFEGVVLKEKGGGPQRAFTVRKLSFGVGVERTFPVHSPKIERIEVVGRGEVRRAKLYYLRGRVGRKARLREMRDFRPEDVGVVGKAVGDGAEEAAAEAPPQPDASTVEPPADADAVADAPAAEEPAVEEPVAEEPAVEEEEPVADEPEAEEDAAPPEASAEPQADEAGAEAPDQEQAPAEGDKQGQSA
jgi:large subunit ribosomal protein L19